MKLEFHQLDHRHEERAFGLGWDEKRIEETLFGDRQFIERRQRAVSDFLALHEQLRHHRHLTLQLAWEEYRQIHPDGYGYSRFCELLRTVAPEAGCGFAAEPHAG